MDTMAWIELAGLVGIPIASAIYFLIRQQIAGVRRSAEAAEDEARKTTEALAAYKIEVSKEYLRKDDFKDAIRELKEIFHRELGEHNDKIGALFNKLDKIIQGNLFDHSGR